MNNKYLTLLSQKFPTIDSVISEIVNLSAIRSLPKGTEYFFSDIHGEYEAFLHMLKSASGMIKIKIDKTFGKTVSSAEREALAHLIYYPHKEIKKLDRRANISDIDKGIELLEQINDLHELLTAYRSGEIRENGR